jgi:hypothetical protein
LKVKNTIGSVSLRKEGFLALQLYDPSSYAGFREESRGVEPVKALPSHFEDLLAGRNSRVERTSGNSHGFTFEVGCSVAHTVEVVHTRTVVIGARGKGGKAVEKLRFLSKGWLPQSASIDRTDLN